MGRPSLEVGTFGKIDFQCMTGPGAANRVRARANFRDLDGVRRQVTKWAPTKAAAERALKTALRDRAAPGESEVTSNTRLSDLAGRWLADVERAEKSANTLRVYRVAVASYVNPSIGGLRLREVGTPAIDRAIRHVVDTAGSGAARTTRSVLSGMLGLAARHGAIPSNPVREASSITTRRKAVRALTRDEVEDIASHLRANPRAAQLDLCDLADFMLGTGVRIGEACAIRVGANPDGEQLLDLVAGTVEINATVVRVGGRGLIVQQWPKSDAGWRRLALPPDVVKMIERRQGEERLTAPDGIVFGSPGGHLRDPNNTSGDLREILDGIDCERCGGRGWLAGEDREDGRPKRVRCDAGRFSWVTSHVFRKTVATRLDEAGLSAWQIADQLGHAHPSLTQDV
jgi:integrase